MFKETDNVIRLGKWAYLQIPIGSRCKGCRLLYQIIEPKEGWYCGLRPAFGLIFDESGPFKDTLCPSKESR